MLPERRQRSHFRGAGLTLGLERTWRGLEGDGRSGPIFCWLHACAREASGRPRSRTSASHAQVGHIRRIELPVAICWASVGRSINSMTRYGSGRAVSVASMPGIEDGDQVDMPKRSESTHFSIRPPLYLPTGREDRHGDLSVQQLILRMKYVSHAAATSSSVTPVPTRDQPASARSVCRDPTLGIGQFRRGACFSSDGSRLSSMAVAFTTARCIPSPRCQRTVRNPQRHRVWRRRV